MFMGVGGSQRKENQSPLLLVPSVQSSARNLTEGVGSHYRYIPDGWGCPLEGFWSAAKSSARSHIPPQSLGCLGLPPDLATMQSQGLAPSLHHPGPPSARKQPPDPKHHMDQPDREEIPPL